ncbi:MAG: transcriptional repressor [Chromatiales bacterium]|nr:MAG: transcriptional repressor [Chromatiales bacterium]
MYDGDYALRQEDLVRLLESRGVTPTEQRLEVGKVVLRQPQHLSADEILAEVNREQARVSKATVYNTLKLFVERGLVREINVDPTRMIYDSTTRPHHHFYNSDSGRLYDIEPGAVEISAMPRLPDGTVEDGVEVIIRIRNRP